MSLEGTIIRGINNIYSVSDESGRIYLCRIKGKVLKGIDDDKSPLTPADRVLFDPEGDSEGLVIKRLDRKNQFSRYNLKRRMVQTLFVNVDQVVCVVSVDEPTLRPGFIDRVLLCGAGIPVVIAVNKVDLPAAGDAEENLKVYISLGYRICRVSAVTGEGMEELRSIVTGRRSAFFGQSGVGKSTLVNLLVPEAFQRTTEVSVKYNKGRHTTNFTALLADPEENIEILDTPGVREIEVPDMNPASISHWYPEMREYVDSCRFTPCLHIHEPGCAVKNAVETGTIDPGRYERYVRITREQLGRSRQR